MALNKPQKVLLLGVGLPMTLLLGYGGFVLWRMFKASRASGEDGDQPIADRIKEFVNPNDPKCRNVENQMDTPAGCREMRVLAYNRGAREQVVIGELPSRPGFYLQKMPVNAWAAFQRLEAAARAAGHQITVNSTFRTMAKQEDLYSGYIRGKPGYNLSAKPGFSNHQYGITVDMNVKGGKPPLAWLMANGPRYGFHKTVPSEDWHWEYKPETDQMRSLVG